MPRGPNEGQTHNFDVTLSVEYYEHLRLLARKKGIGATANAVAAYLLTQRIEQMLAEKYHNTEIPKLDD